MRCDEIGLLPQGQFDHSPLKIGVSERGEYLSRYAEIRVVLVRTLGALGKAQGQPAKPLNSHSNRPTGPNGASSKPAPGLSICVPYPIESHRAVEATKATRTSSWTTSIDHLRHRNNVEWRAAQTFEIALYSRSPRLQQEVTPERLAESS
jgi:hypothetical protein